MKTAGGSPSLTPTNPSGATPMIVDCRDEGPDLQCLPEHVLAAELRLPKSVAHNGDVRSSRNRVFGRVEESAERRLCVEETEERRVDARDLPLASGVARTRRQPPFGGSGKL